MKFPFNNLSRWELVAMFALLAAGVSVGKFLL